MAKRGKVGRASFFLPEDGVRSTARHPRRGVVATLEIVGSAPRPILLLP